MGRVSVGGVEAASTGEWVDENELTGCGAPPFMEAIETRNESSIHQLQKKKKAGTRAKCPECTRIRDMPDAFSTSLPDHYTGNFSLCLTVQVVL